MLLCLCGCGGEVKTYRRGIRFLPGHFHRVIGPSALERFLAKVALDGPNGCHLWTGAQKLGYGIFRNEDGRTCRAHRWAYEKFVGPIPSGLLLRHVCDVPPCVNVTHLIVGTHADNSRDMVERERQCRGSALPSARLDEETVRTIRQIVADRILDQRRTAALFGVSEMTISNIVRRRSWTHL
jgi:hypothetical protein